MTRETEPPRWLDETQQQAWAGIRALMFRAFPEMERTFAAHDLSAAQYQIFAVLSDAPGETLGLSELAASANLSKSRLTHRLRILVESGEVEIIDDSDDRRAKNATLTEKGRKRLDYLAPLHVEDVQRLIFDSLTPKQTEALADAMSAIADHVNQYPEFLNPRPSSLPPG